MAFVMDPIRGSDHFFAGVVVGFLVVVEVVPVVAGFAVVEPVESVVEPVVEPALPVVEPEPVAALPAPVVEPLPIEPEPIEPEPVEPLPIVESVPVVEPVPVLGIVLPVLGAPVLAGVAVDVVLVVVDVSVVPEFVMVLSGDFAGSLSPPHATAPATRATLRTT